MSGEIPIGLLRKLIKYDPETGLLTWLERNTDTHRGSARLASWNSRCAGKLALTSVNDHGYLRGSIYGVQYRAHRVAWALHYGAWPEHDIDHINGKTTDNRIENLRLACQLVNQKNAKRPKNNSSGHVGVGRRSDGKGWIAQITVNYKNIYLGSYSSLDDAVAARQRAQAELGFHQNHGRL